MAGTQTVTLFKGGVKERDAEIDDVTIPDVWKIVEAIDEHFGDDGGPKWWDRARSDLLDCWHIAGALKRHIQEH